MPPISIFSGPEKYASPLAYFSGPAKEKGQPQRVLLRRSQVQSVWDIFENPGFQLTVVHFFPKEENRYPPENYIFELPGFRIVDREEEISIKVIETSAIQKYQ